MVNGEVDRQGRCRHRSELTSPDQPVVPVGPHPIGEGQTEQDEHRSEAAAHYPQPGMTFADVMHQGCDDDVSIFDPTGDDAEGGMMAVSPIGSVLGEEELGELRGQPSADHGGFGPGEPPGGGDVEETSDQMGC